jgi:CSLREA domain-containing protein
LIVLLPAGPFATTLPVAKAADTNNGTWDPDCSLREAIDAANTNPGLTTCTEDINYFQRG